MEFLRQRSGLSCFGSGHLGRRRALQPTGLFAMAAIAFLGGTFIFGPLAWIAGAVCIGLGFLAIITLVLFPFGLALW